MTTGPLPNAGFDIVVADAALLLDIPNDTLTTDIPPGVLTTTSNVRIAASADLELEIIDRGHRCCRSKFSLKRIWTGWMF